jgi:hypothetical protein
MSVKYFYGMQIEDFISTKRFFWDLSKTVVLNLEHLSQYTKVSMKIKTMFPRKTMSVWHFHSLCVILFYYFSI